MDSLFCVLIKMCDIIFKPLLYMYTQLQWLVRVAPRVMKYRAHMKVSIAQANVILTMQLFSWHTVLKAWG